MGVAFWMRRMEHSIRRWWCAPNGARKRMIWSWCDSDKGSALVELCAQPHGDLVDKVFYCLIIPKIMMIVRCWPHTTLPRRVYESEDTKWTIECLCVIVDEFAKEYIHKPNALLVWKQHISEWREWELLIMETVKPSEDEFKLKITCDDAHTRSRWATISGGPAMHVDAWVDCS